MSTPPLRGVKCLDLSRQLPGPFCSMLLADLGVDVLMISAPNDPLGIGIPLIQRNKRSMTLNLKTSQGREIFFRLAQEADIILEGFRPGVTQRLGIDYETLSARNPRLIYCSISGYGQNGPYRNKVGHDLNYLGYAGVLGVSGGAGQPPTIMPVQVADIGGGALMATVGILAALFARQQTGRGQFVDISMLDGSVVWNVFHILMFLVRGSQPERGQTQLTGHYPCYSVYETKDGKFVTVGALEPHFWANLCEKLGLREFIPDQFAEGERREEMFAAFRRKFKEKSRDEWVRELEEVDVCFGPVNDIAEALSDPQVLHRRVVEYQGDKLLLGCPIQLSETPARRPQPPPSLGAHTEEVLTALGFSSQAIANLRQDGVV
ncbi:MAG: CoA transferase [Candidatus Binatia bacterium]|nr:MAG: CoA transferase [Candidatus Binatia bacterium]